MMNEMSELYSFFTGIESLSFFVDETGKKLREIGQEEMRECLNNPINFIRKLLEVKENCERMCATSFAGDRKFVARLNEEFEVLVNRCRQVAEYFAVYLDFLLKSSAGGNLPLEVNSCTFLFRFIHEKDVFERIYKKSLAKRLLSGTSTCYELEKAVVTKLRTECGFQFTQKMEHMLRDVETWQKMNDEYSEHCKLHSQIRNIKFNIRVATAGVWPLYTDDYVLSPQLSPIFQEFSNFYTSKHKGRKLTLCRSAGYASLLANFEPAIGESRQKTISTSTLQMLVLLQFNLKNNWTFKELLESTKMSVKDLGRNLVALTCKGQNVLISSSKKSTDFDANDVFSVNEQFQSSSDVVKVAAVAAYHQSDKAADTREKTEIDRKFEVEACIVRLMKRNRKMNHDELIANVLEEMKDRCGVIGTSTVKQRIEALIEREFIARDSSEFKVYCYVE
ncbi:unnamed protein product [Caenorhabditis auriculariae]|uniref:Cullin family profile domain-containing protein n=1 Tax=Caenorhabditis auriculariae TaxID=2777116 RepID=A0A8S1GM68_9PELO|nr:unnamed protein product [Caenorhabditis auriculariae]